MSVRLRSRIAVASAGLGVAVLLAAPSWVGAQEPPVVERESVRVVRLSVLALDGKGNPVRELTPEALEATLGGRTLVIAGLEPENAEVDEGDTDLPDVRLQIEMGTNVAVRRSMASEPRYWVIFIDTDNDLPGKNLDLAEQVGEFIESSLTPGDFVSVVSYNGSLHVEKTLTTDFAAAAAAVREAYKRSRTSAIPTHQRVRSLFRNLGNCQSIPDIAAGGGEQVGPGQGQGLEDEAAFPIAPEAGRTEMGCVTHHGAAYIEEMRFRSDSYYRALEHGIRLASGMPGGPAVLAVSHGVTVRPQSEFMDTVRAYFGEGSVAEIASTLSDDHGALDAYDVVTALARDQGVTLYFVDPSKPTILGRSARQDQMFASDVDPVATAWAAPHNDLQLLADASGGSFAKDPEVVPSLAAAVARENARLAVDVYVPDEVAFDELAGILVTAREPGVEIIGERLELSPSVPPELRVTGSAQLREQKPRRNGLPGMTQIFLIGVKQREMDYEREGDNMVADLALTVRVETADGRHLVDSPHVFRHTYPLSKWEAAGDATLAVRGWLEAPPGDYKLFAEFRNARTRKTGVIEQDIHIP